MVNELATDFAGLRLTNPFIVGACPCTADSKHIIAAANAGWGGAVTKTITSHPLYGKNLTPCQIPIREGDHRNHPTLQIDTSQLKYRDTIPQPPI
jgi:hypothetical protein